MSKTDLIMYKGTDNFIGFICGLFGGAVQTLLDANPHYPSTLLQACITAMVCGASGYLGKELIVFIRAIILKKKYNEKD